MDRTERFYKIQTMPQGGRPVRMDRFLAALEVSKPTFRRDLEYLRDRMNVPIVWDRTRRGYRLDQSEGPARRQKALRTFSVETIRIATLQKTKARDIEDRILDEELSSGYGIFAGKASNTAKLRFTARRARWIEGEIWHSKQRATFDGESYVLEVPYSDDRELLQDILRYGPDVEVLAPESLREKVLQRLREAAAQYEGD